MRPDHNVRDPLGKPNGVPERVSVGQAVMVAGELPVVPLPIEFGKSSRQVAKRTADPISPSASRFPTTWSMSPTVLGMFANPPECVHLAIVPGLGTTVLWLSPFERSQRKRIAYAVADNRASLGFQTAVVFPVAAAGPEAGAPTTQGNAERRCTADIVMVAGRLESRRNGSQTVDEPFPARYIGDDAQ